ncbi:MAG: hypothetical protein ACRYG8_54400 [Janthinobacterium lividum]
MKPILVLAGVLVLTGCADTMLSDSRIRDSTALALNQPASAVTISGRRGDGPMNTYYVADTPKGSYRCLIGGGSISQLGITEAPVCSPVGSPLPAQRHRNRG